MGLNSRSNHRLTERERNDRIKYGERPKNFGGGQDARRYKIQENLRAISTEKLQSDLDTFAKFAENSVEVDESQMKRRDAIIRELAHRKAQAKQRSEKLKARFAKKTLSAVADL